MENKALTPSAASALARLKLKTVKPKPRVPIEDTKTSDSRRSRRESACVQGTVVSERLSEPVACVIRNLSATGARLDLVKVDRKPFVSEDRLPDYFTLAFRLERTEVDCRIVWRRGDAIGVRFLSLPRLAGG